MRRRRYRRRNPRRVVETTPVELALAVALGAVISGSLVYAMTRPSTTTATTPALPQTTAGT